MSKHNWTLNLHEVEHKANDGQQRAYSKTALEGSAHETAYIAR